MKTEDLIDMLASGPDVRVEPAPLRLDAVPMLLGVGASVLLMATLLGVRADLGQALVGAALWTKAVFAAALAAAGIATARRLSVPGASLGLSPLWLALPFVAIWGLGVAVLWQASPDARAALFWGRTWRVCPALIALLSLPVFGAALLVMRRRAPTRPRLAGAAAGLAAGAVAALVYCLHCPETSPAFVGVWYVLGMLVPAGLGALVGPRVLAW